MEKKYKPISRDDINPLFTRQGREELRIFRRNCNIFSIMLVVASWIVAYRYDIPCDDCTGYDSRQYSLSLCLDFNLWKDLFEGALCPVFMSFGLNALALFVIGKMFIAPFIYVGFSKKVGVLLFVSAALLNNYLSYGFLLKPILMIGTLAAPILFIVFGAIGIAGVVVGEIKRLIKDFLNT